MDVFCTILMPGLQCFRKTLLDVEVCEHECDKNVIMTFMFTDEFSLITILEKIVAGVERNENSCSRERNNVTMFYFHTHSLFTIQLYFLLPHNSSLLMKTALVREKKLIP
jgi:hypothetical protein